MPNPPLSLQIVESRVRGSGTLEIRCGALLLATVFIRPDGVRYFHLAEEAAPWSPHWVALHRSAREAIRMLDAADEELRLAQFPIARS